MIECLSERTVGIGNTIAQIFEVGRVSVIALTIISHRSFKCEPGSANRCFFCEFALLQTGRDSYADQQGDQKRHCGGSDEAAACVSESAKSRRLIANGPVDLAAKPEHDEHDRQ